MDFRIWRSGFLGLGSWVCRFGIWGLWFGIGGLMLVVTSRGQDSNYEVMGKGLGMGVYIVTLRVSVT